jgi:hypothetical protein
MKKNAKNEFNEETFASVKKEMAKPRMAKSARLGKLNLDTARIPEHEADVMSGAAQKYLLSKLDASEPVPNTIWIFACNAVGRLEERFLSRCSKLPDFNSYGASEGRVTVSNALAP